MLLVSIVAGPLAMSHGTRTNDSPRRLLLIVESPSPVCASPPPTHTTHRMGVASMVLSSWQEPPNDVSPYWHGGSYHWSTVICITARHGERLAPESIGTHGRHRSILADTLAGLSVNTSLPLSVTRIRMTHAYCLDGALLGLTKELDRLGYTEQPYKLKRVGLTRRTSRVLAKSPAVWYCTRIALLLAHLLAASARSATAAAGKDAAG